MPAGPETSSRRSRLGGRRAPGGRGLGGRPLRRIARTLSTGRERGTGQASGAADSAARADRAEGFDGSARVASSNQAPRLGDQAGLAAEAAERLVRGGVVPRSPRGGRPTSRRRSACWALIAAARSRWRRPSSSRPRRRRAWPSRYCTSASLGLARRASRKLASASSGRPRASWSRPRKTHHRAASAGGAGRGPRIDSSPRKRPSVRRHSARAKRPTGSSRSASAAASRWGSASSGLPCIRSASPLARRRKGSRGERARNASSSAPRPRASFS